MNKIYLGTKNDTFTYAVEIDGRFVKMDNTDIEFEEPDAQIFFDSGIYPSITDLDQYMCDKVSN
jgi:hypothetical protein